MVDIWKYCVVFAVFVSFPIADGDRRIEGSIILPPLPLSPDAPLCTSYNSLCHMAYNLNATDDVVLRRHSASQLLQSSSQICRCPNDGHCAIAWSDMSNSIIKRFKNNGIESQVKISYCRLDFPPNVCRKDEPTLVTRGRGPFQFEIYEDFRCLCHRDLYAHRTWSDGVYDYTEYSCGKPKCALNQASHNSCARVTLNNAERGHTHEYLCRCRRHHECTAATSSDAGSTGHVVYKQCIRVHVGSRRRLRRRLRRRRRE